MQNNFIKCSQNLFIKYENYFKTVRYNYTFIYNFTGNSRKYKAICLKIAKFVYFSL